MAGRLTAAEKAEKATEAVALSARGHTYTQIAELLDHDRKTVKRWIDDELAKRAEHRGERQGDRERAIAVYSEIIREAWEKFDRLDPRSLNVSGLLNAIRTAQERIDKLTGVEAPVKHAHGGPEDEYEVIWHDIDPGSPEDITQEEGTS